MGHWSALPVDLLLIVEECLLFYVDKIRIRAICVYWNSHLPEMPNRKKRQFPWLLQEHENPIEASHALFNPTEKKFYLLDLPEAQGQLFKGSSYGWVATIGDKHSSNPNKMYLINPITRARIELPSRNKFPDVIKCDEHGPEYCVSPPANGDEVFDDVVKVVMSSGPSRDDCLIVAIYTQHNKLAYCKLNDKIWRPVVTNSDDIEDFVDIIFHKGKLHALNSSGLVLVNENKEVGANSRVAEIGTYLKYLVAGSDGRLIMVVPYFNEIQTNSTDTIKRSYCFRVFKLLPVSALSLEWVEVKSIGDDILFVGLNSCFSLPYYHYPEYKGNHIYFTDSKWGFGDFSDDNEEENSDVGVFSLEDGTIQSLPGLGSRPKFVLSPSLWLKVNFFWV